MNSLFRFVARVFYTFLDVSGILLGVFLMTLGFWSARGNPIPHWVGWIVFALGICAFLIHLTHFVISKKRGSDYFYTTRRQPR